jgi:hypothetical protein
MKLTRTQYQLLAGVQDTHELATTLISLPNAPINVSDENDGEQVTWSETFEPEDAKQVHHEIKGQKSSWSSEYVQVGVNTTVKR